MANINIIGAGQDTAHRAPKKILDACCGSRMMWFDKGDNRALFVDNRMATYAADVGTPSTKGRSPVVISPDILCDFRELPIASSSFPLVVFDPPHVIKTAANHTGIVTRKYGTLPKDWESILRHGFLECFRVLCVNGTLIFKWAESDISVSDVLKLTDQKPLFGHRSGKKANTHWIVFMKEERPSCAQDSPAQNTMEICHTAPNSGRDAMQVSLNV